MVFKNLLCLILMLLVNQALATNPSMCSNFRSPKCQNGEELIRTGICKIPTCRKISSKKIFCPIYDRTEANCSAERFRKKFYTIDHSSSLTCTHDICKRHKYKNSIDESTCADPAVYFDNNTRTYYHSCSRFELYSSQNLKNWTKLSHKIIQGKIPTNGNVIWADRGKDWAPEITKIGNNFVAYLTLNDPREGRNTGIIGVATGTTLEKPLVLESRAIVKNDRFGVIDPSYFKDPKTNKHYLLFKLDTNKHSDQKTPSRIMIRELDESGLKLKAGSKTKTLLLGGYEHSTKYEGQDMIEHNGFYYLFYTTGMWRYDYRVRVVRSKSPLGPFDARQSRLFLTGDPRKDLGIFYSPGHGKFVNTNDGYYYLYHALKRVEAGAPLGEKYSRYPLLDQVIFRDGWPIINPGQNESHPSSGSKALPKPLQ